MSMRGKAACVPFLILFSTQSALAAVTFTAATSSSSGRPLSALAPGDTLTIDVTMRSDGEGIYGLGVSAVGYDPSILAFTSGSIPADVLNAICFLPGLCFGGIANTEGPGPPSESTLNTPGLPEVQLFNGITGVQVYSTGTIDQGVITGIAGDPQFQLVFTAANPGTTTMSIGANAAYGDNAIGTNGTILSATNATLAVTVVPEPATALLLGMGLAGLAGLASAGRRS